MGISMNGPSGIDTASLIDQLVALETSTRVTPVQKHAATDQVKIDSYTKLQSYIADIAAKAFSLSTDSAFNVFKTDSSDKAIATISGDSLSTAGKYDIGVFQTARIEKMISSDGKITSQSAALSTMGVSSGAITIAGASITISATDTLQDLRSKINRATTPDGKAIGVTATVLKLSDTNYRLVLSSNAAGGNGVTYGGQGLVDLGIISNPLTGEKGSISQILSTAAGDDINLAFAALNPGDAIQYAGTDANGNAISNTFIADGTNTVSDLIAQMRDTFHGMVDVAVDATSGQLTVTDKNKGPSRLALSSFSFAGVNHQVSTTTQGKSGPGVLQTGRDAFFSVDGLNMQSATNTASGFIQGSTLNLLKASPGETVNVEISRDTDAISTKIQAVIDSYNSLAAFVKTATSFGTTSNGKATGKGDLAGDMTATNIVSQFRGLLQQQFDMFGGSAKNLISLGVKTDYTTGLFTTDKDKMKSALDANIEDVIRIFKTTGIADNGNISFGRSSKDTKTGKYTLEEINGGQQLRATLSDLSTIDSSVRVGEIVSFASGSLNGLILTSPQGTIASGSTVSFSFQKGLGDLIKEMSDKLNDSKTGTISMHQQSLNKGIAALNDRIARLQTSVSDYRDRLVRQFAAMETAMQKLKSQSGNMLSALSNTNYNSSSN